MKDITLVSRRNESVMEKNIIDWISFNMIEGDETFMQALQWACKSEFQLDISSEKILPHITEDFIQKVVARNMEILTNGCNGWTEEEVAEWNGKPNRYSFVCDDVKKEG